MGKQDYAEDYEEKKPGILREILGFLVYVAVVTGITFLIITFVGQRTYVSGSSMENTLSHGDNLIVDKITYRFSDPKRYDIIVFPFRYQEDVYYIKRIIGLPGETVQIADGKVMINGEELKGDKYCLSKILDSGNAAQPVTLGEDEYFVLGDNRNMSTDSRSDYVGLVHRKDIVGEVFMRIWPFSHWGLIPG